MCISCGVPHVVAPNLMGWTGDKMSHCVWKKQPETPEELHQAIAVLEVQELGCHRYAGDDPAILKRISAAYCDHLLPPQRKPRPVIQSGGVPIHFRLLDERDSFLARVWKRLVGAKNK
ncbi:MAG TPA: hypothetical protein VFF95_08650 [Candidatus Binatus sp.]|nr:hypothetical protein [Candidatus Binatus sp.]